MMVAVVMTAIMSRRGGCTPAPLQLFSLSSVPSSSLSFLPAELSSLPPSANLIRSALSPLYPRACASGHRAWIREAWSRRTEGRDMCCLSAFSVDVQREVLHRDWIREMNTIESWDSLVPKLKEELKEELKSCGIATCRFRSERMSWFVTVSSWCLGIGRLWPCLAAMTACEGRLPNKNRTFFGLSSCFYFFVFGWRCFSLLVKLHHWPFKVCLQAQVKLFFFFAKALNKRFL